MLQAETRDTSDIVGILQYRSYFVEVYTRNIHIWNLKLLLCQYLQRLLIIFNGIALLKYIFLWLYIVIFKIILTYIQGNSFIIIANNLFMKVIHLCITGILNDKPS